MGTICGGRMRRYLGTVDSDPSAADSARLQIREMAAGDLDRVMAIAASLDEAPEWTRASYETALDRGRKPERVALVADWGEGRIAGFVVASVVLPEAEIELIAVEREFQRRGVARKLVQELVRRLGGRGIAEVLLEVRASNHGAASFYRALGFSETGRRPGYYSGPAAEAVLMRLKL
jgi:[ribosomal protein S18]-alanine N-acetyltransferase